VEVDFAMLADRAEIVNGKLYLLGGAFDTLHAPKVPIKHQALSLTMRFLFSVTELDRNYKLEVRLIDENGKKILSVPGQFGLRRLTSSDQGYKTSFLTAINFFNTQFPKFGDYAFEIFMNGRSVKSVPLRIVERQTKKK